MNPLIENELRELFERTDMRGYVVRPEVQDEVRKLFTETFQAGEREMLERMKLIVEGVCGDYDDEEADSIRSDILQALPPKEE